MPEVDMSNQENLKSLRPNVGFMLHEAAGYHRVFEIELADVTLPDGFFMHEIHGQLALTRTREGIWVEGDLEGSLPETCSRCLDEFRLALQIELAELFYFPPSKAPEPTNYVIQETGVLDLVEPVREEFVLSLPIRALCRADCRGLCDQCGENLNLGPCSCDENEIDPRLAALLRLKEELSDE
jgi:uncharacterized protein